MAHLKTHSVTLTEYEAQYGPPKAMFQDVVQSSHQPSLPESSSAINAAMDTVTVSESHSTVTLSNLQAGPIHCFTDAHPMELPSSGIKSNTGKEFLYLVRSYTVGNIEAGL